MLGSGIESGLGVILAVLRDLQVLLRDGPVLRTDPSRDPIACARGAHRRRLCGRRRSLPKCRRCELAARAGPSFTVSPRRARMSTTRPEASEITGTVREMSGNTVPVTNNCDGAWYSVAVTIGYYSGCSTAKKEGSTPEITLAGGGASAAASAVLLLQPLIARHAASVIGTTASFIALLFIECPRVLRQGLFRRPMKQDAGQDAVPPLKGKRTA